MERSEAIKKLKELSKENLRLLSNGCRNKHFGKCIYLLQSTLIDLLTKKFDLLYMPSDTLYGNKYKYILSGIDVASRYKVARPLRTKQAKDVTDMITDIYKVGSLTYPKIFQIFQW